MAYIGTTPTKVVSRQSVVDYRYTATAGQTAFTGADLNNQVLACNPADMDVRVNGVTLDLNDWSATANTLTLAVAATAGDEVTVSVRQTFEVADTYAKTTADDRFVNASGDTVSGALAVTGDLTVDTDTLYVDSTNNRVGIGTSSPAYNLDVEGTGDTTLRIHALSSGAGNDDDAFLILDTTETGEAAVLFYQDGVQKAYIDWYSGGGPDLNIGTNYGTGANIDFQPEGAVAMRIDPSGDVWINGNNSTTDTRVLRVQSEGYAVVKINGDLSNTTGEPGGAALQLAVDGTGINGVVSYINTSNDSGYGTTYTGTLGNSMLVGAVSNSALFFGINSAAVLRVGATVLQPVTDNVFDLGASANRYDDIYATNGTIQTSDVNEKQDIAELDEAEKRVAVAAKGLIRKYRWKDAVAEKGDDARIHVGIIAQDLQAAFAAEGLDAGRYAMFISSTWWEADEVIPAVDEVLDDEGNVVTEAQPERTVTHHYETAEEAPEGATERTRLGVRYPELLAFIIGAM